MFYIPKVSRFLSIVKISQDEIESDFCWPDFSFFHCSTQKSKKPDNKDEN